jgi:Chromosome segregation ATPases
VTSRYAASAVGDYLLKRFGFTFLEAPHVQPLEDAIWEVAREAQLHRREIMAIGEALAGDLAYVAQSIEDGARNIYEPLERGALHDRAKAANDLERRVQQLIAVHQATVVFWNEHGKQDRLDQEEYTRQAGEVRTLHTRCEGLERHVANLEESLAAVREELDEALDEKTAISAKAAAELLAGREEMETAKAVLEATQRKLNEANKALNQAAVTVADMRHERNEAQKEAHDLRAELDGMAEARDEAKSMLADVEGAHRLAVDEYHSMVQERDEERARAEAFKEELRATDEKLNAALDRAQEQQNRADKAEEDLAIAERQLQR